MFYAKHWHKDWYFDGGGEEPNGEDLWRLDVVFADKDFQIQLFAKPMDFVPGMSLRDDGWYEGCRVFIERDRRDVSGDVRIDYAGHAWPIADSAAERLLGLDSESVKVSLHPLLQQMANIPRDDRYCGTVDEQRAKLRIVNEWGEP